MFRLHNEKQNYILKAEVATVIEISVLGVHVIREM